MSDDNIIAYVRLGDVPALVADMTGRSVSRATVYNWVTRGWLKTTTTLPMRTSVQWVDECLAQHRSKK